PTYPDSEGCQGRAGWPVSPAIPHERRSRDRPLILGPSRSCVLPRSRPPPDRIATPHLLLSACLHVREPSPSIRPPKRHRASWRVPHECEGALLCTVLRATRGCPH